MPIGIAFFSLLLLVVVAGSLFTMWDLRSMVPGNRILDRALYIRRKLHGHAEVRVQPGVRTRIPGTTPDRVR